MEGPPLGPGGEDFTWPDQVAPRGRKASSTRKIKPQTSNLKPCTGKLPFAGILLFHANLPRTAFGCRLGNLTLTTDVGKTCLCERSGHFSW